MHGLRFAFEHGYALAWDLDVYGAVITLVLHVDPDFCVY